MTRRDRRPGRAARRPEPVRPSARRGRATGLGRPAPEHPVHRVAGSGQPAGRGIRGAGRPAGLRPGGPRPPGDVASRRDGRRTPLPGAPQRRHLLPVPPRAPGLPKELPGRRPDRRGLQRDALPGTAVVPAAGDLSGEPRAHRVVADPVPPAGLHRGSAHREHGHALGAPREPVPHRLPVHGRVAGNDGRRNRPDPADLQRRRPARPADYKRLDLLLRLWERVRPVTGGQLVIVGDGPERARLQTLAGPGVVFTGRVSEQDKHRLLCSAWLLVHPALIEGWGIVVSEAAIRGTPAVAFDVPGLRDSVVNGETGILVAKEGQFASAWASLAIDGRRREALGRAARTRALQLHWSAAVEGFEDVAEEAIKRAGREPSWR